jgi:hypothetical protein
MSNQGHGNIFEDVIIMDKTGYTKKQYEVDLPGGSGSKFDMVKGHKGAESNVSVKTTKDNTVYCGDVRRIYKASLGGTETPYTIIIGKWKQDGKDKVVNEIIEFQMIPKYHTLLWGDITFEMVDKYIDMVKGIPHGPKAQEENKPIWEKRVKEIRKSRGWIQINTKVDSDSQRRVQCSFRITDFIKNGIPCERFTEQYNSLKLPYLIVNSPPRTFN